MMGGLFLPLSAQTSTLTVLEYSPAPGQFVGTLPQYDEGDDAASMAYKCTVALSQGSMITLGAWGGYVTFRLDHQVVNVEGERDLVILGNAIDGSSEAGIVSVSRDVNGNGIADDPWYELAGSADSLEGAAPVYGYELTYSRQGDLQDIPWSDNQGNEGTVCRNAFHQQEYFPQWLPSPLSFSGTRLPDNAHDVSGTGSYWLLDAFSYGYVDNRPNYDTVSNSFDIEWAVDPVTRTPVHLPAVDFIRVYTALNQQVGWLGETSTEVSGAWDLHPEAVAGIECLPRAEADRDASYDISGSPLPAPRHGLVIKRGRIRYHIQD